MALRLGESGGGGECDHPEQERTTLHGFGQRADSVRKFYCRKCQRYIDLDELQGERIRAEILRATGT